MPTERVVEVVCRCPQCGLGGHNSGLNPWRTTGKVVPDSLAAAMLTLAEAVDEKEAALHFRGEFWIDRLHNAICAYETALAAVRHHPDYRRPE